MSVANGSPVVLLIKLYPYKDKFIFTTITRYKTCKIFPCYADILDHLENIRDKKILIVGRKRLTSWV